MSNIYILDVSAAQHGRIGGKEERLMERGSYEFGRVPQTPPAGPAPCGQTSVVCPLHCEGLLPDYVTLHCGLNLILLSLDEVSLLFRFSNLQHLHVNLNGWFPSPHTSGRVNSDLTCGVGLVPLGYK